MTRQTSIEAYNQIKAEGLLSKLRFVVYDCIFHNGPITQGECVDILQKRLECGNNSGTIASRFAELKNFGVIQEVGKRPCKLTGRTVLEWDVTDKLPVEFERVSKDQIIRELQSVIESQARTIQFLSERAPKIDPQLTLFQQAS